MNSLETPKFVCALIPFRLRARQSYRPQLADGLIRREMFCTNELDGALNGILNRVYLKLVFQLQPFIIDANIDATV